MSIRLQEAGGRDQSDRVEKAGGRESGNGGEDCRLQNNPNIRRCYKRAKCWRATNSVSLLRVRGAQRRYVRDMGGCKSY